MYVKHIDIENYRNIGGCSIDFAWPATYIVGENGLGKTNLLQLFNAIFNRSTLREEDFTDLTLELTVTIELVLADNEIGFFNDYADSADPHQITIEGVVEDPESEFKFMHKETGEEISGPLVRRVCYFLLESFNADSRMLDYSKDRGVGRVLTRGLTKYQEDCGLSTLDFFDASRLQGLVTYLDSTLQKLTILSDYGVHAGVDESESGALGSIVTLTDSNNLHFRYASSGVQYIALAVMQILESIMKLPKRRLEQSVFTDVTGNKVLSVILALDEPEVHLHPYMQRTLTKYLEGIVSGSDDQFNSLLKEYFDIDSIKAQLIVVTHSPSIVPQDYKKIVRFSFDKQSGLSVKVGTQMQVQSREEKRLVALFDTVKEALFARSVIVVEGESEQMSLPGFAEKLGFDLDAKGIVVVNSHGINSAPGVCKLLREFGLPVYSIVDRDKKKANVSGNDRTTNEQDFEAEVIDAVFNSSCQDLFIKVLEQCESYGRNKLLQANQLENSATKYLSNQFASYKFVDMDFTGSRFDGKFADEPLTRMMMYSWMSNQKGVLFGRLLGQLLPVNAIPQCYSSLIKAVTI
jgi:putative ATP-dependent endonuclease protein